MASLPPATFDWAAIAMLAGWVAMAVAAISYLAY